MPGEEILVRVGVEAVVGPAVASLVSRVLSKRKMRKRCSTLYTMLLSGPVALRDEVAKLGVEEGCWTESFVRTFRRANKIVSYGRKSVDELIEEAAPSLAADVATGDVDKALAKAVREANEELLRKTLG